MIPVRNVVARRSYAVIDSSRSALGIHVSKSFPPAAPAVTKTVSKAGGITVATLEDGGPVSRLAVVVKGGSRYEPSNAPGAAHLLKGYAFGDSSDASSLKTIREAEIRGNTLFSSVGREEIVFGSEFLREDLVDAVPTLLATVSNALYNSHDFSAVSSVVLEESKAALSDPSVAVLDALHKVAFRGGLGNSLFASPTTSKTLSAEAVKSFAESVFSPANIAIVGSGVAHADLVSLVESLSSNLTLGAGSAASPASSYHGGEARIDALGPAHYVIAGESYSFTAPEYAATLVLKQLLGNGFAPPVKYSAPGTTYHAPLVKISSESAQASAFNASYSDAGVFGVHVVAPSSGAIKATVEAAVAALKAASAGKFAADDLVRARKAAILEVESASKSSAVIDAGRQALLTGGVAGVKELVEKIGNVSVEDVAKVATHVVKSRASVVALGNVRDLPYADELSL
ncbi:LuxS/MPP-like metallohydrolase [Gonapodya prolifera JEL478]|uniref:Cytochrome b-c1 complex subunit 2, mitochondrial n=1 Tax=Gonapodya prolifera (strain JEL478) TaxID=1344416 RepID=A0A139A5D5_GONPJ|nr:LuxS/MPP-like metallohydrolase [Gonapodya prolifera JEL478]|eukprot:KXS12027.1 LuxS/MPP-like metallohydrolase [Gonapodya prolifera JEL478]